MKEKTPDKTTLFFGLILEPFEETKYGQWLIWGQLVLQPNYPDLLPICRQIVSSTPLYQHIINLFFLIIYIISEYGQYAL